MNSKIFIALGLTAALYSSQLPSAVTPMAHRLTPVDLSSAQLFKDITKDLDVFNSQQVQKSPKSLPIPLKPFYRELALKDPDQRIALEFKIPERIKERTAFWFDVYTAYGNSEHIIHHVRYPWIIFKVVDTSPIENDLRLHRWTRYHRARNHVRAELNHLRGALNRLARRQHYRNLDPQEQALFDALASVPGRRQTVFRSASQNLRIQLGQKDFFIAALENSSRYMDYIESEFTAAGLPTELARLPFVESSFNEYAQSKVGASGIWQIMPRTGQDFFIVNDTIDERNSPLKASVVAIQILRRNHQALNDWPLAITAYNHGVAGIRRVLRESRSNSLYDLIDNYYQGAFRFASANFYPSFLASLYAEKYHKEIFSEIELNSVPPVAPSIFRLDQPIRAQRLIELSGIDPEIFEKYNLDLRQAIRRNTTLPRGLKIVVPDSFKNDLEVRLKENKSSLIEEAPSFRFLPNRRS